MAESTLDPAANSDSAALSPAQRELVEVLRNIGGPLFAVLDASRETRMILGMLRESGEEYQSLYAGAQGRALEAFAPYLVRFSEGSTLLDNLIAQGWGKNWGIFVVSGEDFQTLRKHFRTFLIVKGPEGQRLYFRFYDPRALRTYLPTCNAEETGLIFGPVAAYVCESETPDVLLVFQPDSEAPRRESYQLTSPGSSETPGSTPSNREVEELKMTLRE